MNIRRVLVVAAMPLLIGSVGLLGSNQANATNPSRQVAQAAEPSNQQPNGQRRPPKIDFAAAATKLGVTEAQLKAALGVPAQPPSQSDRSQRPRPDFKAAAAKLGVTEQKLKEALGVPAQPPSQADRSQRPPRPDFKAAAAKLGVTEEQLVQALGVPPRPPQDGNQSGGDRPSQP